jgi:hypothetical protein
LRDDAAMQLLRCGSLRRWVDSFGARCQDRLTVVGTFGGTVMATGHLGVVGEHDWLAVTLQANQAYLFTVTGLTGNGTVEVLPASLGGNNFAINSVITPGATAATENVWLTPNTAGTYYVDISDPNTIGNYGVSAVTEPNDFPNNTTTTGTITVTCFVSGTSIATTTGSVLIEDLQIGDQVRAMFVGSAPVKWIGRRNINFSRHPDQRKVWPVRIAAGAFGESLPRRNLWLSPDHAVFINDVLIPIKYLVNGTTIQQIPVDEVTYYHVELPRHDVLMAEGLSVESYLDTGDRSNFTNGVDAVKLHPDFSARMWEAMGCAPLIVTGPALDAARTLTSAPSTLMHVA